MPASLQPRHLLRMPAGPARVDRTVGRNSDESSGNPPQARELPARETRQGRRA
jgi:hypothetical protein